MFHKEDPRVHQAISAGSRPNGSAPPSIPGAGRSVTGPQSQSSRAGDPAAADLIVIGAGIVGLCTALSLSDRGLRVCLIGEARPGEASPAAAGILGPSLEDTHGPQTPASVHAFALAARDRYVEYLPDLIERSGLSVSFNRLGILEAAMDTAAAEALRQSRAGEWVDGRRLTALEPALEHAAGAIFFELDGAVDNVAMLRALRTAAECASYIVRIHETVAHIIVGEDGVTCTTADGEVYHAPRAVLAAGAWVSEIDGLPRALPISPLRGQMLAVGAPAERRPRHVIYGPRAYIVPRAERIAIGATLERVGFDVATTAAALADLRAGAAEIIPALAQAPMLSSWAGLRPATPDLLPIIGPDPDSPALIYACGHSRNGILMAPLTADCITALVVGDAPPVDVGPFRVDRFPVPLVQSSLGSSSSE
jgi:glycine oxidase